MRTNGRPLRRLREYHAYVVQARNEATAIDFGTAGGAVAEPDDVCAALVKSKVKSELLGVVGEGNETRLAVDVITHEDGELAAWQKCSGTIGNDQSIPFEKRCERWRAGQIPLIVAIDLLSPVRRMNPGEFKALAGKAGGIAGIHVLMQVARPAIDGQFLAHIAARSAAGHWVEDTAGIEEAKQVLDEVPAAVARI